MNIFYFAVNIIFVCVCVCVCVRVCVCVYFSPQVERFGTGYQGHHAWAPIASVVNHFDAPKPADSNSC